MELLREADEVGVLLRGHLWLEALVEYATRNKLERPDAIDWASAHFDHKLALGEAVGAIDPQLAVGLRGFNRLRNRIAHELDFAVSEDDVKTFTGLLDAQHRRAAERVAEEQLDILRRIGEAEAQGFEVEFAEGLEWFPRVVTPARARLFGFVIAVAREIAVSGAFASVDRIEGDLDPTSFARHLDAEVVRLTGGLFNFQPLVNAMGDSPPEA